MQLFSPGSWFTFGPLVSQVLMQEKQLEVVGRPKFFKELKSQPDQYDRKSIRRNKELGKHNTPSTQKEERGEKEKGDQGQSNWIKPPKEGNNLTSKINLINHNQLNKFGLHQQSTIIGLIHKNKLKINLPLTIYQT